MMLSFQLDDQDFSSLKNELRICQQDYKGAIKGQCDTVQQQYAHSILTARVRLGLSIAEIDCCLDGIIPGGRGLDLTL